jgi:hypothetical protein
MYRWDVANYYILYFEQTQPQILPTVLRMRVTDDDDDYDHRDLDLS